MAGHLGELTFYTKIGEPLIKFAIAPGGYIEYSDSGPAQFLHRAHSFRVIGPEIPPDRSEPLKLVMLEVANALDAEAASINDNGALDSYVRWHSDLAAKLREASK